MANNDKSKIVTQKDGDLSQPKHSFPFFPKFEFKVPFFIKPVSVVKEGQTKTEVVEGGENENGNLKSIIARFPHTRPIVPPPIQGEFEESPGRTHNPVVIWQLYALGGFLIVKWIWARWQERNERAKKSSDDNDNQSNDEYQSPGDDEE